MSMPQPRHGRHQDGPKKPLGSDRRPRYSRSVSPLKPPDRHYWEAASGWLDLGNPREAAAELDHISPALREHPAVLEMRWRVHAGEKRWDDALQVAQRLARLVPEDPGGWIDQSYALHELRRTREAWDLLLPIATKFPKVGIIPYNLACYACQMGDRAAARQWLAKAVEVRGKEEIRRMALKDKDLEPLWPDIRGW